MSEFNRIYKAVRAILFTHSESQLSLVFIDLKRRHMT